MQVEQTEFWTDEVSLQRPPRGEPGSLSAEDYFAGEDEESAGLTDALMEAVPGEKLQVSEPVEVLRRRAAEEARAAAAEAAGSERGLRLSPMEAVEHRRATVVGRTGSMRPSTGSRFNMTRMLTLTGSLDHSDHRERWLQLPARAFRAIFTITERRTISPDFLKDIQSPPRNAWQPKFDPPRGGLKY